MHLDLCFEILVILHVQLTLMRCKNLFFLVLRTIETEEGGKREIKIHTFFLNNLIRLPYLILRLSNSLELSRQHININNRLKGTLELLKFNDSIL